MHKNIQTTKFLLLISTIILVVLSAYYSIVGLSSLFAGKKLLVAIMATGFQISKITILSILTIYWRTIFKTIKYYFIFSAIALVLISSSGIYSYLSQAYLLTIKQANGIQNKTNIIQTKIKMLQQRKNNILKQNQLLQQQVQHLSRQTQNVRLESQRTKYIQKFSNKKIKNLQIASNIDQQIFAMNDSILAVGNSSVNQHSGTFIQIARLFGVTIDQVAQFFLFLIILIFDPLAVLFVIVINLNLFTVTLNKEQQKYDQQIGQQEQQFNQQEQMCTQRDAQNVVNQQHTEIITQQPFIQQNQIQAQFKKKDLK